MLQSCTTIVFNSPSPDLKWHLHDCDFHPNTMAVLETIIKSEKAESMWIQHRLRKDYRMKHDYKVIQTIMSESLRVGKLDIVDEHGDAMLKILPLLRQEHPLPTAYYPCMLIHLDIDTHFEDQYHDVIDSIQHWTPRVKKLFLHLARYGNPSRPFVHAKLIQAVWKNLHLQLVKLDVKEVKCYDDENTKNADEQCSTWLE